MLFIHCQQEEGHHDQHHTHGSHAVSRRLTEPQEQRYTYKRPGGKADQLPLRVRLNMTLVLTLVKSLGTGT